MKNKKKKANIILYSYCVFCIILSLVVAWTNVYFFNNELKKHDKAIVYKIRRLKPNMNGMANYMDRIKETILIDDLAILYDYANTKVIDSINVVIGEKYEEKINELIVFEKDLIKLDCKGLESEFNTYIEKFNLKISEIYGIEIDSQYRLYYIPERKVRLNYLLVRLLSAVSVSCFFLTLTSSILARQIKTFSE